MQPLQHLLFEPGSNLSTGKVPLLSKSEFLRGYDCGRRLWLSRNRKDLRVPFDEAVLERMAIGQEIGKLAQKRYANGVFAASTFGDPLDSVEVTKQLMAEGHQCLFEPTFVADGLLARADVLWRDGDAWVIDEVKSSSVKAPEKIAEEKVLDLAFQVYVLRKAGLKISLARMVLVDGKFIWDGGEYDPHKFLGVVDLTSRCEDLQAAVAERASELAAVLPLEHEPPAEINVHCKECEFLDHCFEGRSKHDLIYLPLAKSAEVRKFRLQGIESIDQIPVSHQLTGRRSLVRDVVVSGQPFISPQLKEKLAELKYPAAFIDFESCGPTFPSYLGTTPWQAVCFQWSAHIISEPGGEPVHYDFLACDSTDPRADFCKTLFEAIKDCGSFVHYTAYEKTQLKRMSEDGIPFAKELLEIFEERSYDLHSVVKDHVYFADFMGRTSIKVVLPCLVPSMSYKHLSIQNGDVAATAFRRMLHPETDQEVAADTRKALLDYCCQDTLAMVEIYNALGKLHP